MRIILSLIFLTILFGCTKTFEPEINGLRASQDLYKNIIYIDSNNYNGKIEYQKDENLEYSNLQINKERNGFLLIQKDKQDLKNYKIVRMDLKGVVTGTLYSAPTNLQFEFEPSTDDSLLLLKTYDVEGTESKFTFFNVHKGQFLNDTISIENGVNISLENVWSPDSKQVIISQWKDQTQGAFIYNLTTKDTSFIDTGKHFIWSPTNQELIAYIKDYSVYIKNVSTGKSEMIYKGAKKDEATHIWWDPKGEFLMVNLTRYYLNIESKMTWSPNCFYLRVSDKAESKKKSHNETTDTWR